MVGEQRLGGIRGEEREREIGGEGRKENGENEEWKR